MTPAARPGPEEDEPIVVRDKRRFDPTTGEPRIPDAAETPDVGGPAGAPAPPPAGADAQVAELTDTLQRVQAEYVNYRKRSDRDRLALLEVSTGNVLAALLPVLDDIERARTHGDLTGAFGAVGEALIGVTTKLGLESYATAGEEFDPQVHEAVMQAPPSEDAKTPVVAAVFRPGYRHGGRVLRAAQVSVSEPAAPLDEPAEDIAAGDVTAQEQEGTAPEA